MHSILANTAIERIPTFQADHDYSQLSLGDAGIEFTEELFVPVFEQHLLFLLVRHEVPTLPMIHPRPELRVIHIFSTPGEYTSHIDDTHTCGSGLWFHRNNRHVLSSCLASCCSSWTTFDKSFNHPHSENHRGGTCRAASTNRRKYQCRACIVYTSFIQLPLVSSLKTGLEKSFSFEVSLVPFFELRRPGEFVDRWSTTPVLVPGLTLVLE